MFVLAEQTDRAFQAVELVQKSLIERIQSLGVVSGEEFTRQMSSYDVHRMLKDKIAGLPQLDAVVMFNAQGNLVNFSRYWPIPAGNISDRVYFKALQSDAQLISTVSEPVRNRSTGTPAKLSFASQHKSILSRVQMHKEFMKETLSDFLA